MKKVLFFITNQIGSFIDSVGLGFFPIAILVTIGAGTNDAHYVFLAFFVLVVSLAVHARRIAGVCSATVVVLLFMTTKNLVYSIPPIILMVLGITLSWIGWKIINKANHFEEVKKDN